MAASIKHALYRSSSRQQTIIGDINIPESVRSLPKHCDVIINAVNPPIRDYKPSFCALVIFSTLVDPTTGLTAI
ncbi:MAG: hypothetical protein V3U76_06695 [Granulosicoccus sp.]